MEIGDEVIIVGKSRYRNGYPIGSIGYIIKIDGQGGELVYIITTSLDRSHFDWFGYKSDNIKLSKKEVRDKKLKSILND